MTPVRGRPKPAPGVAPLPYVPLNPTMFRWFSKLNASARRWHAPVRFPVRSALRRTDPGHRGAAAPSVASHHGSVDDGPIRRRASITAVVDARNEVVWEAACQGRDTTDSDVETSHVYAAQHQSIALIEDGIPQFWEPVMRGSFGFWLGTSGSTVSSVCDQT